VQAGLARPQVLAVWGVWLLSVVLVVVGVATGVASATDVYSAITGLTGSVAAVSLATVGAILVTRLPRNAVGWLLWVAGVLLGLSFGLTGPPSAGIPGGIWLLWLGNLMWVPAVVLVGVILPLVYPTGHLPSRRWRAVVIVAIAAIVLVTIQAAFSPFSPGSAPAGVSNPLAVGVALGGVLSLMSSAATVAAVVCFPLAAASLVVRYRRASGVERAQLKWFAAVAALIGLSFAVALVSSSATSGILGVVSNAAWLLLFVGLALLPVAIGIAVLRYRLYEIDRLISRTIGWGVLTVILGAVFVGLVLGLQTLLAPFTGSNDLAVAGSTLIVFALFAPIRRRVQRLVDGRFNRTRYDAERTVAAFAERLRDEVDLEQLRAEILATVTATVEPSSVSLWLRD
jgi:hypothetical protein